MVVDSPHQDSQLCLHPQVWVLEAYYKPEYPWRLTNSYSSRLVSVDGAWVRLYTDDVSRTNDNTRVFDQDPDPGSGVIEVRTTVAWCKYIQNVTWCYWL